LVLTWFFGEVRIRIMSTPTSKDESQKAETAATEAKAQPAASSAPLKELLDFEFVESVTQPRISMRGLKSLGCS
jgi:hypothetical protein